MQKFRDVLSRWEARRISALEAAEMLGMSERSFRRYRGRYEEEGLDGLLDRRLGRTSARAVPADEIEWLLDQYRSRHMGWTVKHFHDYLRSQCGFKWGYTWTKTQLHTAGLVVRAPRRGGPPAQADATALRGHDAAPEPARAKAGDGSTHDWLQGLAPLDLIVTLDDATSEVYSAFLVAEEGTASTFRALLQVFCEHGLPAAFYTDRGSHYFHTPEAGGKVDKTNPTQVGRALRHLGIEHIAAYSPEARGRSERAFATFQDRLVKEMKLAGIGNIADANRFIAKTYLPDHNARFAVPAHLPDNGFTAVRDRVMLAEVLCVHEQRVVGRDNTVRYKNKTLQLPQSPLRHHYVKARVTIHEYPDGTLSLFHGPGKIASYGQTGNPITPEVLKNAA